MLVVSVLSFPFCRFRSLCRIWLYGVKSAGAAGATARPAGGTSGAVLGRAGTTRRGVSSEPLSRSVVRGIGEL
jgi:hypothetical protein